MSCRQREPPLRFATKRDLTRHQQTHDESGSSVLTCPYCGESTGRRDNLQRHIDTIHNGGVCKAAKNGDEETVQDCLLANPQVIEETDQDGHTPFLLSCIHGQEGIARMLLDKGACSDPDTGPYALWLAVLHDKTRIVKLLMGKGFTRAEWKPTYKSKAFAQAATDGDLSLVKRYTEIGGDIDTLDSQGRTALVRAAENGHEDTVKHLIEHGAKLECTKIQWLTIPDALLIAARRGHVELLDSLLPKKPGSNSSYQEAILFDDQTQHEGVLRLIAKRIADCDDISSRLLRSLVVWEKTMAAQIILEERNSRHPIRNNTSLLFHAAELGRLDLVVFLLEQGVDVGAVVDGQSPLHAVANLYSYTRIPVSLQINVLRVLLDRGSDIEALDHRGYNVLHWATIRGRLEVVTFLLEAGANPHAETSRNQVAVDLISQKVKKEKRIRIKEQLLLAMARTPPRGGDSGSESRT